jgi:hypothetical protein
MKPRRTAAVLTALCLSLAVGALGTQVACSGSSSSTKGVAPVISNLQLSKTTTFTTATNTIHIGSGETVYLQASFAADGGTAVLTPGNVAVQPGIPVPLTNITQTTTYTLTVTSKDGKKATSSASVNVYTAPVSLAYATEDMACYRDVRIVANAATLTGGTGPWTYSSTPTLPNGLSFDATGAIVGTPTATSTGTYTVKAENPAGQSITKAVRITVAETPLRISVNPRGILSGSATLTWDGDDVASLFSGVTITASPADASLPSSFDLAGSATVSPTATTTYTITANIATGGTVSRNVTLYVGALAVDFQSFSATPLSVAPGGTETTTLQWVSPGLPDSLTLNGTPVAAADITAGQTKVTPVAPRSFYTLVGSNTVNGGTPATAKTSVGVRSLYYLAGTPGGGRGNVDGPVDANGYSTARFYRPNSITWDEKAADGSMIVCDFSGNLVRRIAADRTVTTIAGTPGLAGTDSTDPARSVKPRNSAVDPVTGDIYVGGEDYTPKRLLKLAPKGDGTYAPSVVAGFTYNTNAMVIDSAQQMYFIPYGEAKLYKMDLTQASPVAVALADVAAVGTAATAMAKDFNGGRRLLYVVGTQKILKVDIATETAPVVSTLTGTGTSGFVDSLTAASGTVNAPQGVAVDTAGNVYIADRNNYAVRMVPASGPLAGALITIAGMTGTAKEGYASSTVTLDGTATLPTSATACLSNVYYVAAQGNGGVGTKIYVADAGASFDNQAIRVITVTEPESGKLAYTLDDPAKPGLAHAGGPIVTGSADGVGAAAQFNFGTGCNNVATLPDGSMTFVADTNNNSVRVVLADGTVSTLQKAADTSVVFNTPKGIALQTDPATKAPVALFVADTGSTKKLRRFTPSGSFWVEDDSFAPTGADWPASPTMPALAVDSSTKTLYAADSSNKILKLNLDTLAATALVNTGISNVQGLAVQVSGADRYLWAAAYGSYKVFKFDTTAVNTALLTIGSTSGYADGAKDVAKFSYLAGIAVDSTTGKVYVPSTGFGNGESAIRQIDATTGAVSTVMGGAFDGTGKYYFGQRPGLLPQDATTDTKNLKGCGVLNPVGLALSEEGDLFITSKNAVLKAIIER